jgi:hypothetical protein
VSVWIEVCLVALPRALMRGPRPHDRFEWGFRSRVSSFISTYHHRGCNGLTFRTPPLSYTRLTAQKTIEGLRQQGIEEALLPAPSTMAVILNRLGFRLRNVVKSKPLKKVPETDAIFANVQKKTRKRR